MNPVFHLLVPWSASCLPCTLVPSAGLPSQPHRLSLFQLPWWPPLPCLSLFHLFLWQGQFLLVNVGLFTFSGLFILICSTIASLFSEWFTEVVIVEWDVPMATCASKGVTCYVCNTLVTLMKNFWLAPGHTVTSLHIPRFPELRFRTQTWMQKPPTLLALTSSSCQAISGSSDHGRFLPPTLSLIIV